MHTRKAFVGPRADGKIEGPSKSVVLASGRKKVLAWSDLVTSCNNELALHGFEQMAALALKTLRTKAGGPMEGEKHTHDAEFGRYSGYLPDAKGSHAAVSLTHTWRLSDDVLTRSSTGMPRPTHLWYLAPIGRPSGLPHSWMTPPTKTPSLPS